jgi:hypothetical protein
MAEEDEPNIGTCLAAFLAYAAPFFFDQDPLTKSQTHFLHLARKLLCPLDKDGDIASYVTTAQDEKFVALTYSWLLRQCHDTATLISGSIHCSSMHAKVSPKPAKSWAVSKRR